MPRPKTTGLSRDYLVAKNLSGLMGEDYDCAVKTLAFATGIPYAQAHSELAARGRKKGEGIRYRELHAAIEAHGFTLEQISPDHFLRQYPRPHSQVLQHVTTHHPERFNRVWRDGSTYLFYTTRFTHVLTVRNGETLDWTKGKAKRVHRIYRITRGSKS